MAFVFVAHVQTRPLLRWARHTEADVVQAVFEVSSDATEAVSALAGLSPPAEKSSDDDQERGPSLAPTAPGDTASTTPDDETAATMMGANERLARTLEAIHAQRGSSTPSVGPSATPAGQGDAFTAATTPPPPPPSGTSPAPLKPAAPATEAGSDGDVGPPPAASGGHGDGGNCVSTENVELEKVAAFIANYAGAFGNSQILISFDPPVYLVVLRSISLCVRI